MIATGIIQVGQYTAMTEEVKNLFTTKVAIYDRFVSVFRYAQGLRAYWMESDLPSNGLRVLDAGCGTGMLTFAFLDALEVRGLTPEAVHAFDLTPAMLERLRNRLDDWCGVVTMTTLILSNGPRSIHKSFMNEGV